VFAECELERVGLMTAAEAGRAEAPSMVLAHVLAWHLQDGGGPSPEDRALLRAFVE
jgi:hypothetical protein